MMELTLNMALAIFFAGGFLLAFIYLRIQKFDREYYPRNRKE